MKRGGGADVNYVVNGNMLEKWMQEKRLGFSWSAQTLAKNSLTIKNIEQTVDMNTKGSNIQVQQSFKNCIWHWWNYITSLHLIISENIQQLGMVWAEVGRLWLIKFQYLAQLQMSQVERLIWGVATLQALRRHQQLWHP